MYFWYVCFYHIDKNYIISKHAQWRQQQRCKYTHSQWWWWKHRKMFPPQLNYIVDSKCSSSSHQIGERKKSMDAHIHTRTLINLFGTYNEMRVKSVIKIDIEIEQNVKIWWTIKLYTQLWRNIHIIQKLCHKHSHKTLCYSVHNSEMAREYKADISFCTKQTPSNSINNYDFPSCFWIQNHHHWYLH